MNVSLNAADLKLLHIALSCYVKDLDRRISQPESFEQLSSLHVLRYEALILDAQLSLVSVTG